MMRLARGLWSVGWLMVLLAGIPAALIHYVGWPLPDHWPSRLDAEEWVQHPLTRPAVVGTVAVLVWVLWALLVYALIIEVLTRAGRAVRALRRLRLPPLPTPMQATASGVLGVAVFGVPTGAAGPSAPALATPPAPASAPTAAGTAVAVVPAQVPPRTPGDRAGAPGGPLVRGGTGVPLADGGWVTDHTAAATASAAALAWLQRRRRYLPRPPAAADRDDPDLTPLPDSVAALTGGWSGDGDDDDQADGDIGAATQNADAIHPAVVGDRAGDPLQPRDLPAGGVGLTGEGALAAARGILTATLLSGDPWHPAGDARIITTPTDLDALLGRPADRHPATPGLTAAASLCDALTAVEQAAIARTRSKCCKWQPRRMV